MDDLPILVTGATGLVGNNVVRQLLARGRTVRVLVRPTADSRPLAGLSVQQVEGDVADPADVRRACRAAAAVIHAAGLVQIGRSRLEEHRRVNVEGSRIVARAARAEGLRMIHVSSTDTLGVGTEQQPADEQTPVAHQPPCSYVISKREAEQAVLDEVAAGLDGVIVNPGFMLGPWDWKPSSGRMLLEVMRGRALMAPRGWFTICDVRDVTAAILAAIDRGRRGQRYILAGQNMTYFQAWRLFAEVGGGRPPWLAVGGPLLWLAGRAGDLVTRLTGREPDVNSGATSVAVLGKCYTSAKAAAELGYRSRPVRETIVDTCRWFAQQGWIELPAGFPLPADAQVAGRSAAGDESQCQPFRPCAQTVSAAPRRLPSNGSLAHEFGEHADH